MDLTTGYFKASYYFYLGSFLATLSIISCYFISQYLGQQKPFPDCWISTTAGHYPQYIIFRLGTISGVVLFVLGYFVNYFWLKWISYKNVWNLNQYKPKIPLFFGILGVTFLTLSTALIDTGKRTMLTDMHQKCAGTFFVFTVLAHLYNNVIVISAYRKGVKGIQFTSVALKLLVTILIVIQIYISAAYGAQFGKLRNHIGNIIEYTMSFTLMFSCFLMGYDVRNFKMVYY